MESCPTSSRFSKGKFSENLAAAELSKLGWKILFEDVKVWRTQVDLISRTPSGILALIEVKSESGQSHLSPLQKNRLFRIATLLAQHEPVELYLVLVGDLGEVLTVPVDGF